MSRKHSTLLKEEVDDEDEGSSSGGDKKKRDKDKYQDGGEKKRKSKKGGPDRKEGYYNNSMTNSAKVKPVGSAAINPSAENMTSPIHTQAPGIVPPPLQPPPSAHGHQVFRQGYGVAASMQNQQNYSVAGVQGQVGVQQIPQHHPQVSAHWQQQQAQPVRLPPPPGLQHIGMVQSPFQQQQVQPQQSQAQFQPQAQLPQQPRQPYQPHPQQGFYAGVQYPHGVPAQVAGQGVVFVSHPVAHTHSAMVRSQSLPEEPVPPAGWNPVAPQSPTGESQVQEPSWSGHPQENVEGQWRGGQTSAPDPGWNPAASSTNAQPREGYWAAFSGSPPFDPPYSPDEDNQWVETLDNSSSDEDIECSSSPELVGEEGEGLLRAPSLTSFAESTSSIEEEGEENVWHIQPEQREYYTKQFKRLQPVEGGVVKGPKARDFFVKSNLPTEMLSRIWHLSDINKDNALNMEEFCIAMHLVVAIRHGLELPQTLPAALLNQKEEKESEDPFHVSMTVGPVSPQQENNVSEPTEPIPEDHSISQPIAIQDSKDESRPSLNRPRSFSDPSSLEEPQEVSRKVSMPASIIQSPTPQVPENSNTGPQGAPLSPGPHMSIERPRASAKISLLDSAPGQLLPPPSGKFARDGWAKADEPEPLCPISGESDSDSDKDTPEVLSSPSSPSQTVSMSPVPESTTPERLSTPPRSPAPGSPKTESPSPVVVHRQNKRSGERPRSAGDVNQIQPMTQSDSSTGSTHTSSSHGSDSKKEPPPPPPPRNKKGHSRASSLDLNKLFAARAKESRAMSASSASSSQSSQNSETALPLKSEPQAQKTEQGMSETEPQKTEQGTSEPEPQKIEQGMSEAMEKREERTKPVPKEENFADFSRFDSFVKAQGSTTLTQQTASTVVRNHRRSLSLDQGQDYLPKLPRKNTAEGVLTSNRPNQKQEALPRPVPKVKPVSPPAVKLIRRTDRNTEKDGEKERKLNTEPPKVVVKPLTKQTKHQASVRDLKDKNVSLSRLNSELQQELKEAMEMRIGLELKLERLKPFSST